jgi:uncharacterized protein (TIGR00725 family)
MVSLKIAVIGSACESSLENNITTIHDFVDLVCQRFDNVNVTLLTGGSKGIPGELVRYANECGVDCVAYSPDMTIEDHNSRFDNLPAQYFSEIKHDKGFARRSIAMIHDADLIVMINGRLGTLSEFLMAIEEGKTVHVIKNSGGVSQHVESVLQMGNKDLNRFVVLHESVAEVGLYLDTLS